ncbi:RagB/SusD family nutrient uptake outer membrane protein [Rufibacter roseus]|uniref:RagB/SusD family nutrient uptake outer membrane protein n=1 Tax=Rufibacter roseus TaxID=1567108 RepID=A0ABW2DJU2_9BACT|nr:RagB/SusD family nutrient uptake outer membrane protein [Rufibacter roseus]
MKKLFIYSLLAAGLAVSSCETDLDIDNPNRPTTAVFWQNAQHAQQGVNAVYSTFHRPGFSRLLPFLTIIRSDLGASYSPNPALANAIDKFIQPNYNLWETATLWHELYVGINRANQVLDNVPSIQMDETKKQQLLGEAKFLRGLFYYQLASLWGNVPILLKTPSPEDVPEQATQEQVWAQVQKDLTEAAAALPATYANPADMGRATKGAANALLAKVYMQDGKYDEALTPLQWLVEGEGRNIYSLVPNYRDNFLSTTENNRESVFEIQFAINPVETTDNDIATPDQNYGTSIAKFFSPPPAGFEDAEALRWGTREFLKERTVNNQRDPRLEATYLYDSTDVRGPLFSRVYGQAWAIRYNINHPFRSRVWFRKFLNDATQNTEGFRSPNNWRYIRYADVLLMYAEALNAVGRTTDAYQYVDRVRQRAGLARLTDVKPNLSQTAFLEQIKHERITELAGEGHRWNDLARWGDLGPQLANRDPAFARFEVGKHELLPIPQRDVDINPNIEQNPNW